MMHCLQRVSLPVVAAAALLAITALLLGPRPALAFQSGNWIGAPYNDPDGSFSNCTMTADYRNGITLGFIIDKQAEWGLVLYDPAWNLQPNSSENVTLYVDRRAEFHGTAQVIDAHRILITLSNSSPVVRAMRYGSYLSVDTGAGSVGFVLTGTQRAISMLARCVSNHLQAESYSSNSKRAFQGLQAQPQPAPEPTSQPASPAPTTTDNNRLFTQAEAVAFASNLLSDAGITKYKILDPGKDTESTGFDVVWTYPDGVVGALTGYKNMQSVSLDEAAGELIADDAKNCSTDFASGKKASNPIDNVAVERLFTACRDAANPMEIHYTLFKTQSGHIIEIAHLIEGQAASDPTDDSVSHADDDAFLETSVVSSMK